MDDEQRAFISTNFYQLDGSINEYLVFQHVIPDPLAKKKDEKKKDQIIIRPFDVLVNTVEFPGLKVEAKHL